VQIALALIAVESGVRLDEIVRPLFELRVVFRTVFFDVQFLKFLFGISEKKSFLKIVPVFRVVRIVNGIQIVRKLIKN